MSGPRKLVSGSCQRYSYLEKPLVFFFLSFSFFLDERECNAVSNQLMIHHTLIHIFYVNNYHVQKRGFMELAKICPTTPTFWEFLNGNISKPSEIWREQSWRGHLSYGRFERPSVRRTVQMS